MIMDTYQTLGECLPQFRQYESLFRDNPDIARVLEYVYEDILDFHRKALKIFRHRGTPEKNHDGRDKTKIEKDGIIYSFDVPGKGSRYHYGEFVRIFAAKNH